jgi:hypothetical protein
MRIAIAVMAALCAAFCFALGSLIQQGVTARGHQRGLELRLPARQPLPIVGLIAYFPMLHARSSLGRRARSVLPVGSWSDHRLARPGHIVKAGNRIGAGLSGGGGGYTRAAMSNPWRVELTRIVIKQTASSS